jgi:4-hydroxy-3-methylbut-2-enyl diphosphate reductase
VRTIDATCPLVTKVHQEAKRYAREDFDILLVGHAGHEEVEGTSGEAPSHIQLVETAGDAASVTVRDPEKVVWLSQTTLSVDETMDTVRRCASGSPRCRTRRATTSATPRRTGRWPSRRWRRTATW